MAKGYLRELRIRTRAARRRGRVELRRFTDRYTMALRATAGVLTVVSFVASVACITLLTVYMGFEHEAGNLELLRKILSSIQAVFAFCVIFSLTFDVAHTLRQSRLLRWIVNIGILLTLLPAIYPHPEHPWLPWLEQLLYSRKFVYAALTAYSLVDISYGISRLTSRRTNPSLLLASSFLFFILIGSLVLMMPKCTYNGISYMDSLFVSTSAVCICGLTPVDIATTFTPLGQGALMVMFEIGGLGIITFTSFFAIFFSGRQSVYNQLLVRDIIYSKTMNSLVPTLLYILAFTVTLQIIGAVALYFTIPASIAPTVNDRLWLSAFHAISGFCNVGFSNIQGGLSNPLVMAGGQSLYLVMSVLVFAGALGFPILVNFKDMVLLHLRRWWHTLIGRGKIPARVHVADLNTKIVLTTTLSVFVISAVLFFVLESGNTLRGMNVGERISQSVFNAVMPRSGGFSSVQPADFLNVTLLLIIVQMWIGGSSQSMAGGIKVNTFGAIILNLRAILRQNRGVAAYRRRIAIPSVRRANAVVTLSILSTLIFSVTLLVLEPQLPGRKVVFEAISATFNVGSSLGATSMLGDGSKGVLCVAMFVGRVGLISLLTGMLTSRRDPSEYYPEDNVIIS